MPPHYKHTEAASFLLKHAIPSEEQIDTMTEAELDQFLGSNGIDVPKLNSDVDALKKRLSGKILLAQARSARLAKSKHVSFAEVSVLSQEEIIAALTEKYGNIEAMPIAARNFKSFGKEDWVSLYIDLIVKEGKGGHT